MSNKITNVLIEPSEIIEGSTFLLKIKAIRYATYDNIKNKLTYSELENYTYSQLKGE